MLHLPPLGFYDLITSDEAGKPTRLECLVASRIFVIDVEKPTDEHLLKAPIPRVFDHCTVIPTLRSRFSANNINEEMAARNVMLIKHHYVSENITYTLQTDRVIRCLTWEECCTLHQLDDDTKRDKKNSIFETPVKGTVDEVLNKVDFVLIWHNNKI